MVTLSKPYTSWRRRSSFTAWPTSLASLDVGAHEHDIRAALGDTAARDSDLVTRRATLLLEALHVPLLSYDVDT